MVESPFGEGADNVYGKPSTCDSGPPDGLCPHTERMKWGERYSSDGISKCSHILSHLP